MNANHELRCTENEMVVTYFNVLSYNLPGVYKEKNKSSFRMISFVLIYKHGPSIIKKCGYH
jgi:hypothetical protein